jgi:hypothetical protein
VKVSRNAKSHRVRSPKLVKAVAIAEPSPSQADKVDKVLEIEDKDTNFKTTEGKPLPFDRPDSPEVLKAELSESSLGDANPGAPTGSMGGADMAAIDSDDDDDETDNSRACTPVSTPTKLPADADTSVNGYPEKSVSSPASAAPIPIATFERPTDTVDATTYQQLLSSSPDDNGTRSRVNTGLSTRATDDGSVYRESSVSTMIARSSTALAEDFNSHFDSANGEDAPTAQRARAPSATLASSLGSAKETVHNINNNLTQASNRIKHAVQNTLANIDQSYHVPRRRPSKPKKKPKAVSALYSYDDYVRV